MKCYDCKIEMNEPNPFLVPVATTEDSQHLIYSHVCQRCFLQKWQFQQPIWNPWGFVLRDGRDTHIDAVQVTIDLDAAAEASQTPKEGEE